MDINSAVGRKVGLSDEKLAAVTGGNSREPFSEAELAVIDLADAMVTAPANVSDELNRRLREHFSEEQLLELAATIAFENYRARLNRLYQAESDGLYKSGQVSPQATQKRTA